MFAVDDRREQAEGMDGANSNEKKTRNTQKEVQSHHVIPPKKKRTSRKTKGDTQTPPNSHEPTVDTTTEKTVQLRINVDLSP